MLQSISNRKIQFAGGSYAIVASQYNARYVNAMLRAAKSVLERAGAARIQVVRVPGAFEIPSVAAKLAQKSGRCKEASSREATDAPLSAILCFGVIFQGETSHAQQIGWGVTQALAQIQVQYQIPVVHAVFTFEEQEQARVRCLGKKHNRGTEAAKTALRMARVMDALG